MKIEITSDKRRIDLAQVVAFLTCQAYWARNRSPGAIEKSLEHSRCDSLFRDGVFAGFGRVITDYSTTYYLCDVFVLAEYRGEGLGRKLMEHILRDPLLRGCTGFLLTRDAQRFYARQGFTNRQEEKKKFMIKREKGQGGNRCASRR